MNFVLILKIVKTLSENEFGQFIANKSWSFISILEKYKYGISPHLKRDLNCCKDMLLQSIKTLKFSFLPDVALHVCMT
jgi:hypothetical protein